MAGAFALVSTPGLLKHTFLDLFLSLPVLLVLRNLLSGRGVVRRPSEPLSLPVVCLP